MLTQASFLRIACLCVDTTGVWWSNAERRVSRQLNPDSAANALASAICDAIITASIYFCLRRSQNGLGLLQENSIQKLAFVFVQMGLITFTSALTTSALYYESDLVGRYFTAAPVSLLSKTYSNSMLAVLNARKCIRDQRQSAQASPSELPTLPTRH
ncbi:hypothetical protein EV401DRAFT_1299617 [Pisolithus croceorrhizus]|nr:hypothetical protein EV401DRAFT_1299617 [Pisolithus croceorrhizus]